MWLLLGKVASDDRTNSFEYYRCGTVEESNLTSNPVQRQARISNSADNRTSDSTPAKNTRKEHIELRNDISISTVI